MNAESAFFGEHMTWYNHETQVLKIKKFDLQIDAFSFFVVTLIVDRHYSHKGGYCDV